MLPTIPSRRVRPRGWVLALLALAAVAGLTVLLLALLTNVFERKQEGRQPFVRVEPRIGKAFPTNTTGALRFRPPRPLVP